MEEKKKIFYISLLGRVPDRFLPPLYDQGKPRDYFIDLVQHNLVMCGRENSDFVAHLRVILTQSVLEEDERERLRLFVLDVSMF